MYPTIRTRWISLLRFPCTPPTPTYRHIKVHNFLSKLWFHPHLYKMFSKCINTSLKYHRTTDTQSRVVTKVHYLLGKPSYICINFVICHVSFYWMAAKVIHFFHIVKHIVIISDVDTVTAAGPLGMSIVLYVFCMIQCTKYWISHHRCIIWR